MKQIIIFVLSSIVFFSCSSDKRKTCHLTGKVIDRNSKVLILKKETADSEMRDIQIPIDSSGYFEYDLDFQFVEAYELIFEEELNRGLWVPILFFPDNEKIEFTLYPEDETDKNRITGSPLSLEARQYKQTIEDTYYSQYAYWDKKIDSLQKNNETDSGYAAAIADSIDGITEALSQFELQYTIKKTNLHGYSRLLHILRNEKHAKKYAIDTLRRYCHLFQQKFPNHPYTEIAKFRLNGLANIKVGGTYVDFTAQDATGESFTLSDIMAQNKLTLIDLWAPWCVPSIRKSKQIVPIYQEFKDSGFEVIGVVGSISKQEQFLQAIENHKYPWVLLDEIDDKNQLWEKYYISKSGGAQFLIDRKGNILAINPTPDALKKFILE